MLTRLAKTKIAINASRTIPNVLLITPLKNSTATTTPMVVLLNRSMVPTFFVIFGPFDTLKISPELCFG